MKKIFLFAVGYHVALIQNEDFVGKLLKLGPGDFAEAMAWLAADKRETYEDLDHVQPELELDVYED